MSCSCKSSLIILLFLFSIDCFCQDIQMNPIYLDCDTIATATDVESGFMCADRTIDGVGEIPDDEVVSKEFFEEKKTGDEVTKFDYKSTKYWDRYKTLRTAGWICFGGGIGFCITGYWLMFASFAISNDRTSTVLGVSGALLFLTSPILVATSIPLLSIAYYNRHKAKHMKFDVGMSSIPTPVFSRNRFSTPALSFALNF